MHSGVILVWIVGVGFDPFCWVCFSSFPPVGCVDSSVISVWIVGVGFDPFCWVFFFWFSAGGLCGFQCDTGVDCGCGSVAVWVKK